MTDHTVASYGPDGTYTRHSEGAFLRLDDGRILFVYSRFAGSFDDAAPCCLAASWSDDEGETWTEPAEVLSASSFGARNIMSVSLLRMRNGDIGVFHGVKNTASCTQHWLERSRDGGRTFYRRTECTLSDRPGYYVLNNDRVVRLASGRLVMPLAYHRGGYGGDVFFDGRGVGCFLLSDDDGETWREAADTVHPPFTGTETGLQEPGVTEKRNGALWAYFRTDKMVQYESFSLDGGETWTAAQPSRFTSPISPMKVARHPQTGDLYAVWNPIPNYNGRKLSDAGWGRTPLVWAVSRDDGTTWSEPKVIEGDPEHGYCYPALFFTADGAMLAAYCSGGPEDGICLARLTIRKIAI